MPDKDKNELNAFKNQIFKYGIIIALLCELISLPFLGWNPRFAYGLALGTCIAIVNFNFLAFTVKKTLDRGRGAGLAVVGYMLRLLLYGGSFYMSYKLGTASGLATLLGFMTIKFGLYYAYGFKPKFSESSAKGKKLNDLDNDAWAKEGNRRWYTEIIKAFKPMEDFKKEDPGESGSAAEKDSTEKPESAGKVLDEHLNKDMNQDKEA